MAFLNNRHDLLLVVLLLVFFLCSSAMAANKRSGKGYVHKPAAFPHGVDPESTQYVITRHSSNPYVCDVARCLARNRCFLKKLTCPHQCPHREGSKHSAKACFIDCSKKCQTSCKHRKPNCYGYASVCYDPRFVGGDGIMFYFHGKAGEDFCLVTDPNLHINAHFIGLRPAGRTRDFTWVQALGIMYDSHKFSVAAKKVATWDATVDQLVFTFNGQEFTIPTGNAETWTSPMEDIRIERTSDTNSVHIIIDGVMTLSAEVVPITKEEDTVHSYQLPADDCFAHLNIQFNFDRLSSTVEGVLGQTYQPGFKNPVKVGVPMPVMGGETKYRVSSLFSTDCLANKFAKPNALKVAPMMGVLNAKCTSTSTAGGIVCRR